MLLKVNVLVFSLGVLAQGAPRIIGGHDAPNHKYPYQVSFQTSGHHFCSGSILNERWVLSAAHCFQNRDLSNYTILAGTNFLNNSGTVYIPQNLIIHEKYVSVHYFDIALVRLKTDIVFTEFVKPITLPKEDLQDYSKPAAFAGWGYMTNNPAPDVLQEINLGVLTVEQCRPVHNGITDAHICTLNKLGEGLCFGDSGGPLVVDGVQVGIASYAIPCANNYPDVHTRVWSYIDWIDGTLELYSNGVGINRFTESIFRTIITNFLVFMQRSNIR